MASSLIPLNPFIEFSGPEEERLHLKQRLAAAFRIFGRFGFDEGVAGHITARDPEHADHFWVNPFGMNFKHDHGRRPDLRRPHGRGRRGRLAGQPRPPSPSTRRCTRPGPTSSPPPTRTRCTARRSRRWAARSTRSPRTAASSSRTTRCSTTTPAWCSTSRRASASPTPSARPRRPSSATTGCSPSARASTRPCTGSSRWSARCQAELLARAAGEPVLIDDDVARQTYTQVGTHLAGWFSAQPLFDWIVETEPDLLSGTELVTTVAAARVDRTRRHLTRGSSGSRQPRWTGRCASGSSSRPSTRSGRTPRSRSHDDLDLIEHLDRLGFDEAWIGEHHSAGYEIIASPEVFIAARGRAHHAHPARHRRELAPLPPPADAGRPHGAARPPHQGPGDARRAGPAPCRPTPS